ncbi:MAG: peptidoglycan editing factor PgeF [Methylococcales bacterium]|nr:peptidoglycan editing factor PgeF [Methylococcales bacterium]
MTEHWLQPDWPALPGIEAVASLRRGQDKADPYAGFNLADHVGDLPERVMRNREALFRCWQLPAEPVWLRQVHGTDVVEGRGYAQPPCADASFTEQAGVVLAVLTADCLPILLRAEDGSAISAVHAGWRGLLAGILARAVERFAGRTVQAWLGPAISAKAFIVGDEVKTAAGFAQAFQPAVESGKWHMDLYAIARGQLQALGVTAIYGGQYCTFTEPERFYSYRRDAVTGRMATLIWKSLS